MSSDLDRKPQIWKLALDLGLPRSEPPVRAIVNSVKRRVRQIAAKYVCKTLQDLLHAVAADVGTVFEEIHSDADLARVKSKYLDRGEPIFAALGTELRKEDFGITLRRTRPQPWEAPFVSIIDCRGEKGLKVYFTKWHELAHLLTLTAQMRLVFRRTHATKDTADPEERLMDVIAGEIGFLSDFLAGADISQVSFSAINRIREEFCPGASQQSAMIGIVEALPTPCILLEARLRLKKAEESAAAVLPGLDLQGPKPQLRVSQVTVNDAARESGMAIFKNWRVPLDSVIHAVFDQGGEATAVEDLSWWETSTGETLPALTVSVRAKRRFDSVMALVTPLSHQ